ncbi:MAG TPA: anaerobic ribonucleoside-triphosphate reductase activating protein [Rectinemataceae bacterium]|nr:anaerobic ribonucleoside-triphosphate reductase activating protein [Rectinemataceae bacterium]
MSENLTVDQHVGFRKTSLVDYPAKVTSALFFTGCNFRCPWCHNRELALGIAEDLPLLDECLAAIERRKERIQGVVISGGEPLLYGNIGSVIGRIHDMGLPVKLDTNGSLPGRLETLLAEERSRPDYVALDLKTGAMGYQRLAPTGRGDPFLAILQSLRLLAERGIPFEARSVVCPGFFDADTVEELAPLLSADIPWFFAPFAPGNCLDPAWNDVSPPAPAEVRALAEAARRLGKNALIR